MIGEVVVLQSELASIVRSVAPRAAVTALAVRSCMTDRVELRMVRHGVCGKRGYTEVALPTDAFRTGNILGPIVDAIHVAIARLYVPPFRIGLRSPKRLASYDTPRRPLRSRLLRRSGR